MRIKKTREQWEEVWHNNIWETDGNTNRFAPFLLSYYDLPSLEKRCFSYCSVYPKDYVFDRNELVEMWMSQGYIRHEEEGQNCFETLAMRSLFQDFEMSGYSERIMKCKMHDIVYDFAQFLTKDETITITESMDTVDEEAPPPRHATLLLESKLPQVPTSLVKGKHRLRTLRIEMKFVSFPIIFHRSFFQFPHLRALTLTCDFGNLRKIPVEMPNLRYLEFSGNDLLESLPEWVCDLRNLQTLKIRNCLEIKGLPEGIGKLVNLRHLVMDGCTELIGSSGFPKGLRKLTCLRTLDTMIVPHDKKSYFNMEEFDSLYHLHRPVVEGKLSIHGCGKLKSEGEARNVQLVKREHLVELELYFYSSSYDDDLILLEGLQPHSNLKSLGIFYYFGTSMCPTWMMSLINLRVLRLELCKYFSGLPPLGKLPSLELLDVASCPTVESVGLEFLGADDASITCCFPKLRELNFSDMVRWKKWETSVVDTDHNACLTIMPCLHTLKLVRCGPLEALPDFLPTTPLQNLHIIDCETLSLVYQGKERDKISHIPNIKVV